MRNPYCPRCGSEKVEIERARKPFKDSLVCNECDYVGPASNPNQPRHSQIAQRIAATKQELDQKKPRSTRRTILEARLCDLRLQQLRFENQMTRRKS